jgi:hypothetical protein
VSDALACVLLALLCFFAVRGGTADLDGHPRLVDQVVWLVALTVLLLGLLVLLQGWPVLGGE